MLIQARMLTLATMLRPALSGHVGEDKILPVQEEAAEDGAADEEDEEKDCSEAG